MLVLDWKERAFIEKVNSRCFCWFPAAILVHQNGTPIWRLHTKLYKGAWNVSANNSETVGHKDLRLGQIVYILVFYNTTFSWLLPQDGFQCIFLLRDSENDLLINHDCKSSCRLIQDSLFTNWKFGFDSDPRLHDLKRIVHMFHYVESIYFLFNKTFQFSFKQLNG